jgi:hypothetical protein
MKKTLKLKYKAKLDTVNLKAKVKSIYNSMNTSKVLRECSKPILKEARKIAPIDKGLYKNEYVLKKYIKLTATKSKKRNIATGRIGAKLIYARIIELGGTIEVTHKMVWFLFKNKPKIPYFPRKPTLVIRPRPYLRPAVAAKKREAAMIAQRMLRDLIK